MAVKKPAWRRRWLVVPSIAIAAGGVGWLFGGPEMALLAGASAAFALLLDALIRRSQERRYGAEGSGPDTWHLYH